MFQGEGRKATMKQLDKGFQSTEFLVSRRMTGD